MLQPTLSIGLLVQVFLLAKISAAKSDNAIAQHQQQYQPPPPNCDDPIVYEGVKNGCDLINCTNGLTCGILVGIAKFGNRAFEKFDYPKCVKSEDELQRNTENDGNAHIVTDGPGCKLVQCSDGYQCQVRISISKLGDLAYAQAIGSFPQCVSQNGGTFQPSGSIIENGPGCDKLPTKCAAGTKCVTAVGIAKYGNLPWSQFFWPFCA